MAKITKDMKIMEVLDAHPEAGELLMEAGLGCVGCPMSMHETIEQGFSVHGLEAEEINGIIDELNKSLERAS